MPGALDFLSRLSPIASLAQGNVPVSRAYLEGREAGRRAKRGSAVDRLSGIISQQPGADELTGAMADVDPIEALQMLAKRKKESDDEWHDAFGAGIIEADTPEKWAAMQQTLAQQFPDRAQKVRNLPFETRRQMLIRLNDLQPDLARQVLGLGPGGQGAAPRFDLDIQEWVMPDGRRIAFRTTTDGRTVSVETGKPINLPAGGHVAQKVRFLDTGTGFLPGDTGTGGVLGPEIPKNVERAAEATARGTAKGKGEISAIEQRDTGRQRLSGTLEQLVSSYLKLDEMGAVVNPDRGAGANLIARAKSSGVGQFIGGATGSEDQSIRKRIINLRPIMIQQIRQATGMSARGMDSNRELSFYLQAATDPEAGDIYSNLVAIQVLDDTFGLGGILERTLPPDVLNRVKEQAQIARKEMPIVVTPDQIEKTDGVSRETSENSVDDLIEKYRSR